LIFFSNLSLGKYPEPNLTTLFASTSMPPVSVRNRMPYRNHLFDPRDTIVQLHNSLIISLFDFSSHRRPPTPPPDVPKAPPRKRRRTLPYQGPDDTDGTLRSARLKRWAVSVGKRERDRLKTLPANGERPRPRPDTDEIACERGVILLPEKGGKCLDLQRALEDV
jgi:hypothetical protein